jgi:phosphosulfolactate synthase (CoM biosynthesis protein A)
MGILDDIGKVTDEELDKMKKKHEIEKIKQEAAQKKEREMKQQPPMNAR